MLRRTLLAAALAAFLAAPAFAADVETPPAVDLAAKAEAVLATGDIAAARDAYAAAAAASPDDPALAHQVQVLTRVLEIEQAVAEAELPDGEWEQQVVALHAFYLRSHLAEKALAHDRAAHAKADSAVTASLVAESLLELSRNEEAAAFVAGLREGQKDDQNRLYRLVALARLGQRDLVREDLSLHGLPETKDPGLLYDTARLHALLGEGDKALGALQAAFEGCPARGLPVLRALAKESPDFASLRETEGFAKVLETASKASTGCGCGEGCDGCPEGQREGCEGCPGKGEGGCAGCPKKKAEKKAGGCGCPHGS